MAGIGELLQILDGVAILLRQRLQTERDEGTLTSIRAQLRHFGGRVDEPSAP
jgi:hypothetical protein